MRILVAMLVLAAAALVAIHNRYGGGVPYPDLSTAPRIDERTLETVVTYPEPIGNVAVSADGRVFFTVHPEARAPGPKLLEWKDGAARPYPDAAFQDAKLQTPLGIAIDRQSRLWVIDHGYHGFGTPRLVAIDLATNTLAHDHAFDGTAAPRGSFLQDLQVDGAGGTVFVADVSFVRNQPGIVVYDVASRTARRVLDGHPSVTPQDWIIRTPGKAMVFLGGLFALKPGVDGIAIDKADQYLYYAAMTHDTLYRIAVAALKDASLGPDAVAAKVEAVGKKPLNDGLSADIEGNVLITDVEHGAVARWDAKTGRIETLVSSGRIRWADALSYGPDGWLYVADSAIPEQMFRSRSHIASQAPYFIYRFKPGVDGVAGQ